jgi:hypothetical protein
MVLLPSSSRLLVFNLPSFSRRLPFNHLLSPVSHLLPVNHFIFSHSILANMHPEKTSENGDAVGDVTGDGVAPAPETEAPLPRGDYPWRRAKKVAAMLSFSGKDYFGMQRNPGMRTIEEELMAAFRHSILFLSAVDLFLMRYNRFFCAERKCCGSVFILCGYKSGYSISSEFCSGSRSPKTGKKHGGKFFSLIKNCNLLIPRPL